ncbi:uncharacterized protein BYT42DRAFT_610408 [Radiomyces spectabilis]|uniref:uncharacterized protein n=1 Tax=Radiomyces spectabilis TaxID=64574 RepID=UPI00221FA873|nr:uncharacterized protein BYT42DRAFT_610408 [Radiomyces spectabilis]KAI8391155.1 hypothetical protein BYT42DRAFT_610408 [Radiomyces spectabilis]
MTPALHFETAFWSQKQNDANHPNFQSGLQVLHQKLNQSKVENEEIIAFFKERIAIEDMYGSKLCDQGKQAGKSSGFERDEGAGLKSCFKNMKTASTELGQQHKQSASAMLNTVLKPLQKFHEDYKKNIQSSKQAVDATLKQFDTLVKEAERARTTYHRRCREADTAEEQALVRQATEEQTARSSTDNAPDGANQRPTSTSASEMESTTANLTPSAESDAKIQLGNQSMSQTEFDALIRKMREEIPIKDHRVPILGRYQNTSTGEDIASWLQQNMQQCKDSPAMADIVGQQLIQSYAVLRLIGQRGNKFLPAANSVYQWRINNNDEEAFSASESNVGASAFGGLLEKFGTMTTTTGTYPANGAVEPHKKARSDAERADEMYRSAIKRADQMRMFVEEALFAHFAEMEQVELQRVTTLKSVFADFSSCLSKALPSHKTIVDQMLVFQESLKPDQEIQYIVQQYCVAGFSPKALLYENYYHGIAHDQTFGVPLEELAKQGENNVPIFVRSLLETIDKGSEGLSEEDKRRLWSTPFALDRVHAAHVDLNLPSGRITVDLLQQYEPVLLVAILRLFFLELPECLMTFEFYDAAQALYSNSNEQDDSLRLLSLSNLIASLPAAHFATLHLLLQKIAGHIEKYGNDGKNIMIEQISQSLGSVILRARTESLTTLTSRVPVRLALDLIKHQKEIFSENTLKSHAESEKRRQARPLVASKSDFSLADQGGKATSPTKKRGLMSFMRPNMEDTAKWGVNSMMGVFQRGAAADSPNETKPTINTATPRHFGGSTITQESPPSSPKVSPQKPSLPVDEKSDVMFDVTDHLGPKSKVSEASKDTEPQNIEKTEASESDIPIPDTDLDPFFADD